MTGSLDGVEDQAADVIHRTAIAPVDRALSHRARSRTRLTTSRFPVTGPSCSYQTCSRITLKAGSIAESLMTFCGIKSDASSLLMPWAHCRMWSARPVCVPEYGSPSLRPEISRSADDVDDDHCLNTAVAGRRADASSHVVPDFPELRMALRADRPPKVSWTALTWSTRAE